VYITLPPIYAEEVFGGGPDVLGILLASVGVGSALGGIVVASISSVDRRGLVQIAALFFTCLSLVLFALSSTLWLSILFFGASGFFEMLFLTSNQTLLQLSIPDHLRGRVTSITALSMGLSSLGGLVAGIGSDLIGPQEITLVLCGSGAFIALVVLAFVPTVRDYSMRAAIAKSLRQQEEAVAG
jgi:MFS family permease